MQNEIIRLSKSVLDEKEAQAVSKVILEDGYLGMGKQVQAFEQEIKNYLNTSNEVVCVNTGTSAIHLAIQACGIGTGDEVLVPSLTYVASYQAISATGAKPVSCDIDPATGLMDLNDAKSRITNNTKALLYVHYASNLGDLTQLYHFAKANNIRVIEDAAHSFGCTYKGEKIGSFGDITCFSFDGIKNVTSGEGGAIVTGDKEILSHCKDGRLLGIEKDTEQRFSGERSWVFDVKHQGWRYHMSNVMAAIGRVQLIKFSDYFSRRRVEIKKLYKELLSDHGKIEFLTYNEEHGTEIVPHIIPILVPSSLRDELVKQLKSKNIQAGVHYYPNHFLSLYKSNFPLPHTEAFYSRILTLPTHPDLKDDDVRYTVNTLLETFEKIG